MQLSDDARRVLSHLGIARDAYLFGKRDGDAPLNMIDNVAIAENRVRVDSLPLVDRTTVQELLDAGYINDDSGTIESINVAFKISEAGKKLFPRGHNHPASTRI